MYLLHTFFHSSANHFTKFTKSMLNISQGKLVAFCLEKYIYCQIPNLTLFPPLSLTFFSLSLSTLTLSSLSHSFSPLSLSSLSLSLTLSLLSLTLSSLSLFSLFSLFSLSSYSPLTPLSYSPLSLLSHFLLIPLPKKILLQLS